MIVFTDRLGNEQQVSAESAYETFARHRTFTNRDGSIFVICDPEDEGIDLRLLGAVPSLPYSRAGQRNPDSPLAVGFKSEREWKGFPRAFGDIARRAANEQAASRRLLVSA